MATSKQLDEPNAIPEGICVVPIHAESGKAPVRLCVLVRQTADPVGGRFILLRSLPDACVYLGCLADAGNRVRQWVELWTQNLAGLAESLPSNLENLSNHVLDERWKKQVQAFRELDPEEHLETGWESVHPPPTFLDLPNALAVHPVDPASGARWQLCRDDALLKAAGLPAYSTTLCRYLCQPSLLDKTRFVPVTTGAPENASTVSLASILGNDSPLVPFNPQCGLMMILSFCPLAFEDYVDLLGGKAWVGIEHGKKTFKFGGVYRALEDPDQVRQGEGYLFLGSHGRAGRLVETFHLKLQLLRETFQLVQSYVQKQQLPMLNLSADGFRIRIAQTGRHLPALWTARCLLARTGQSYPLQLASTEFRYFLSPRAGTSSIYTPEGVGLTVGGNGSVRIRKVLPPERDGTIIEGTLVTQERLLFSPHDLVWIQLPLPSGRVGLYGHVYSAESLAQGEARFRTVAQRLPDAATDALRAAEGVPFVRCPFEIVPLLSSPCDLYALGVLSVRTLLVDDKTTLAVALDEVLSLARQIAVEYDASTPMSARIQSIFDKDPRWATSLGPHHLTREPIDPAEAFRLIPPELWWKTLAAVVRLFPGVGPDSFCRDLGDAPSLALESVFNPPIGELEDLLLQSRSLVVIDWSFNREIHAVIKSCLQAGADSGT